MSNCGWNELLTCPGMFHEDINTIRSETSDKRAVLNELNHLLHQDDVLQIVFSKFLVEFEVEIENDQSRREIFANNLLQIAEHNVEARRGRTSYFQAVNRFTYLSDDEFRLEHMQFQEKRKRRKAWVKFQSCFVCSCINRKRSCK